MRVLSARGSQFERGFAFGTARQLLAAQEMINRDNGKSVIVSGAGQFTDTTISGDSEHVHTHPFTSKGLPSKVQTAHGSVLFRDAGLIAFGVVFDGDAFTSSEVANKGPHSEAHSDFTLFCDTVVPALV